ncbi:uncharacterized protein LOC115478581 [Microcaecilia unicolor]|uniref:Uncharacterized protein LOC115478581 n=1 Tax=Microcaecilia unicolor TaxID=1415580 RepID=A0A6P7Z889_9AMPH|nr:uncharacterized protein LOC115478581 [Microcaecilia unicolor]XP_030071909.1 uncharacterized protein LOC115478581 [Microcaecilia unicolor]
MGRPRKAASTGANPSSPGVRTSTPELKSASRSSSASTASKSSVSTSVSNSHSTASLSAPTTSRKGAATPAGNPKGRGAVPRASQVKFTDTARGDSGDFKNNQEKLPNVASSTRAANVTNIKGDSLRKGTAASSQLSKETVMKIEKETRGQRNNPKWYEERENRITASMAHKIANSKYVNEKSTEVPQSYLKAVVNEGPRVQTPAMSWGIKNEKTAIKEYEELTSKKAGKDVKVEECGLFIHPDKSWLAASPDGIVHDGTSGKPVKLLEVKCPYKHRDHTVKDACKDASFCLEKNGDTYALKKDHSYYSQVQCQLAATGLAKADFVVHTKKETAVAPVEFDAKFWEKTEPKLEKFYYEAVIPHLERKNPVYLPEE